MSRLTTRFLLPAIFCCFTACSVMAEDLIKSFANPPDSTRPGVYWYFMDGNLSREGMTRDLESMKAAGIGHLVFLEVNVGVPRGPVDFLSEEWQGLFAHAVHEAERLGIEIILGSGPGWTGSGGPWVKPEESMQHLVASTTNVQGPGVFQGRLAVAPPRRPFFGDLPEKLEAQRQSFFKDVAVLAYRTPDNLATIPDIDEKALVYRAPYSSEPGVKSRLDSPAEFPSDPPGSVIPPGQVLDLTKRLRPDGTLDWEVPEGKWTVLRFVSRNNGASTRPAPEPGIGFECDKFDREALDAHFKQYAGKLLTKVGPRQRGCGWTMLHMDSWEMGAQNWTPRLREEFKKRRGYDPQPFYPAYLGYVVGSREQSERFLWDLRLTGQELVIENHAEHLKRLGRRYGFTMSIEPYDMNPVNDFDLGAVADVPMCEFWSLGFDTAFSCHEASSIAHVMGLPIVAAEAFTGEPREAWRFYPGYLKNQGDWAFATGINRLTYHTFAHKPDEGRPGMVMGPYGVHWDRGQTWWPMVAEYHRYISRCQYVLRQGRTVADILYLIPEGAPNVFQPPASAFAGASPLPDRRGYNFDGCSALTLIKLARVREGRVVFPGGGEYRLLILPNVETMTPALLQKIKSLVRAGATVIGNPPRKSPSLVGFPACDLEVRGEAEALWGGLRPPEGQASRVRGKGRIIWGKALRRLEQPGSPASQQANPLYPSYDFAAPVLRGTGVEEDFVSPDPVRYTHRQTEDREIYFLANRSNQAFQTSGRFRTAAGAPELWDPMSGQVRLLPQFTQAAGGTEVPLRFEPYESYFMVFPRKPEARTAAGTGAAKVNFNEPAELQTLAGEWEAIFDPTMGAPERVRFETLQDWTTRPEPGLKYYSGMATYRTTFDLPDTARAVPAGAGTQDQNARLYLDLGTVHVMARVRVNGKDCGVVWTAPWRVDISQAAKLSGNKLEVEVANLWPNRMIGDAASPDKKFTQTTYRPYKATDPLLPSGLLGPVRLMK